jgi:hypothetical protein
VGTCAIPGYCTNANLTSVSEYLSTALAQGHILDRHRYIWASREEKQSRRRRASDYERVAMAPGLAPTAPSPCEKNPSPLHADVVIESKIFTKNAYT